MRSRGSRSLQPANFVICSSSAVCDFRLPLSKDLIIHNNHDRDGAWTNRRRRWQRRRHSIIAFPRSTSLLQTALSASVSRAQVEHRTYSPIAACGLESIVGIYIHNFQSTISVSQIPECISELTTIVIYSSSPTSRWYSSSSSSSSK